MKIKNISSRKILNSAANWTIETTITLDSGGIGIASVPGGLSKGKKEVTALPVDQAIQKVLALKPQLTEKTFQSQEEFDKFLIKLDNSKDKSNLGANTILSLSISFCKATANEAKTETYEHLAKISKNQVLKIPSMMMLMLEGGVHGAGGATIQEFMAIVDTVDRGVEIYNEIKDELKRLGKSTNVGAEGAFSPQGYDNDQVLSLLTGYLHGEKIALDIAASSISEENSLPAYESMLKNYPIASIEDPFSEDDWTNWELFAQRHTNEKLKKSLLIVTDDLTTTNPEILKTAIKKDVGNAILVKPNQIGTVTETIKVVELAKENGWQVIISHRGTDTNDDFVSDFAVGVGADYVKFGAPARGERVGKYNRLMEIAFKL